MSRTTLPTAIRQHFTRPRRSRIGRDHRPEGEPHRIAADRGAGLSTPHHRLLRGLLYRHFQYHQGTRLDDLGRWNHAQIEISDLLGEGLDSSHSFARFNPGTGLTYKLTDYITAYAGYSEANRAPTAGELNCADPTSPCLLDAFLVSDPDLKQVISRTFEAGLRGRYTTPDKSASAQWYASVFRTNNSNDIILLATDINGFGYFSNAGTTRRQGIETGLRSRRANGKVTSATPCWMPPSARASRCLPTAPTRTPMATSSCTPATASL